MNDILVAVASPSTCLNTTTASAFMSWLSVTSTSSSFWWYTWLVFQVQYYDMPRLPGTRVESPATLGRKCWAFAYLEEIWDGRAYSGNEAPQRDALIRAAEEHGYEDIFNYFVPAYDDAVPLTMELCVEVQANCFLNATYDPSRKGTCPGKIKEFKLGFDRENVKRR
ncbi:hypothetical protein TrRE_jg12820 [Triparma retinervis]|uniref:Uncharacterized protein n=1 Tax=Triparma retinervis TaxID=2557542 RepID=A0A9W7E4B3_9STRA|nr:hypothetical protein TrRE_jg12820 [Triparma retinervis]